MTNSTLNQQINEEKDESRMIDSINLDYSIDEADIN